MTLNPDIILQAGQGGQNFGQQFQSGMDGGLQRFMAMDQLRDLAQTRADKAALKKIAPTLMNADGTMNYDAVAKYQAGSGDIKGMLGTAQARATAGNTLAQQKLNLAKIPAEQLKAAHATMGGMLQLFGSRDTPEEWAAGVKIASEDPTLAPMLQSGRFPTHFPGIQGMQKLYKQGLTIKERMANELATQKAAEQQRQFDVRLGQDESQFARGQAAIESRFLRRPPSGVQMGYDEQGRPVISTGGMPLPKFTEGQSKTLTNVSGAITANQELANLRAGGFDPASASGALSTILAETPGVNVLASEEGQRQNAANVGFAQAVNYQRSGAATPEIEYNRAVASMMDRYGDKPAVSQYKAQMRDAMVRAIQAGGGAPVDSILQQMGIGVQLAPATGSVQNRTAQPAPAFAPRRMRNPTTGETVELQNGTWVPVK